MFPLKAFCSAGGRDPYRSGQTTLQPRVSAGQAGQWSSSIPALADFSLRLHPASLVLDEIGHVQGGMAIDCFPVFKGNTFSFF